MTQRQSIYVQGLSHGGLPIPIASRVGPLVATGGVAGQDPATGQLPGELGAEVEQMFANLCAVLAAAGGSPDDLVKLTIWTQAPEAREHINRVWIALFPDSESRPARHILNYELSHGMKVQCEALAYCTGTSSP